MSPVALPPPVLVLSRFLRGRYTHKKPAYAKRETVRNLTNAPIDAGDCWTWTGICADTKLIASFYVGDRTTHSAIAFVRDLKERLANPVQLTSDGHKAYIDAVESTFGRDVDFAQLVKIYGSVGDKKSQEHRYSPGECIGIERKVVSGNPDQKHISTSFAERANLTMRMHMRRFTRLTNAFSKKLENHACAIALHCMYYNFVRVHQTLKVTPAMAAGVTKRLWEMNDLVEMIEAFETVWERYN